MVSVLYNEESVYIHKRLASCLPPPLTSPPLSLTMMTTTYILEAAMGAMVFVWMLSRSPSRAKENPKEAKANFAAE